jgi:hypothetical protein
VATGSGVGKRGEHFWFWAVVPPWQPCTTSDDTGRWWTLNRAKERERQAAEEESKLAKIKKVVADLQREEASIRNQMLAT